MREGSFLLLPTQALDLALARAQMEEAKWWRKTTGVDLQYRIADIEAAISALEQARRDGKEDHAKKS
jgi:hypothetical protein